MPTSDIFSKKIPIAIPETFASQYIYMVACIVEFINRYSSAKTKDESVDVMSDIICAISRKTSEIGVSGLKEIVIQEMSNRSIRDAYFKIRNTITMKDQVVSQKLEFDIKQL